MVGLSQTSLPRWAYAGGVATVDPTGRAYTLIGVGASARGVVDQWAQQIGSDREVRCHVGADVATALTRLEADLATARVGHRLMVAAAVQDCLNVRAMAVCAGLADDEMRFGVLAGAARTVWCVHCRASTTAPVTIDDTFTCSGCERNLVVYPHVSRRTGQFLGFMVDAEEQPSPVDHAARAATFEVGAIAGAHTEAVA